MSRYHLILLKDTANIAAGMFVTKNLVLSGSHSTSWNSFALEFANVVRRVVLPPVPPHPSSDLILKVYLANYEF
ncbi:unnamed protein product [Arctia plantaginis]|uniref:Uncharacterized protein n=1 Tax=Arctia plantaginis TaxID=874455 RepID=A0A8S1A1J6_ARCPL|nr:unnamed protein product [Arctia plantaginis]